MPDKFLQLAEERRKEKGWSYVELALRVQESPASICQMFKGNGPKLRLRYKVARLLRIPVRIALGRIENTKEAR